MTIIHCQSSWILLCFYIFIACHQVSSSPVTTTSQINHPSSYFDREFTKGGHDEITTLDDDDVVVVVGKTAKASADMSSGTSSIDDNHFNHHENRQDMASLTVQTSVNTEIIPTTVLTHENSHDEGKTIEMLSANSGSFPSISSSSSPSSKSSSLSSPSLISSSSYHSSLSSSSFNKQQTGFYREHLCNPPSDIWQKQILPLRHTKIKIYPQGEIHLGNIIGNGYLSTTFEVLDDTQQLSGTVAHVSFYDEEKENQIRKDLKIHSIPEQIKLLKKLKIYLGHGFWRGEESERSSSASASSTSCSSSNTIIAHGASTSTRKSRLRYLPRQDYLVVFTRKPKGTSLKDLLIQDNQDSSFLQEEEGFQVLDNLLQKSLSNLHFRMIAHLNICEGNIFLNIVPIRPMIGPSSANAFLSSKLKPPTKMAYRIKSLFFLSFDVAMDVSKVPSKKLQNYFFRKDENDLEKVLVQSFQYLKKQQESQQELKQQQQQHCSSSLSSCSSSFSSINSFKQKEFDHMDDEEIIFPMDV